MHNLNTVKRETTLCGDTGEQGVVDTIEDDHDGVTGAANEGDNDSVNDPEIALID